MTDRPCAIITGASSGLGEALAMELASRGYNLTLSARRRDKLHVVRDKIVQANPQADVLCVVADVSDKASMKALVAESVAHFSKVNVMIANAGQGMWCRFRDLDDPDQLKDLQQINYMGVVYSMFFALPHLQATRGSFVAISSIQGVIPVTLHTGYVASKYAVNGFIETMRIEEPDIHFLLALPGWIAGTELRAHALTSSGPAAVHVKKTHGKSAISTERCAREICEALFARKVEIFTPNYLKYAPTLRRLNRKAFDCMVTRKTEGQLST